MKLAKSLLFGAAALALAAGTAFAHETKATKDRDPGFNALDRDNDGSISQAEAKGNPQLVRKFKEADKDKDGKLSRMEYLTVMTKQDIGKVKEKVSKVVKSDKPKESGTAAGGTAKPADKPAQ